MDRMNVKIAGTNLYQKFCEPGIDESDMKDMDDRFRLRRDPRLNNNQSLLLLSLHAIKEAIDTAETLYRAESYISLPLPFTSCSNQSKKLLAKK